MSTAEAWAYLRSLARSGDGRTRIRPQRGQVRVGSVIRPEASRRQQWPEDLRVARSRGRNESRIAP